MFRIYVKRKTLIQIKWAFVKWQYHISGEDVFAIPLHQLRYTIQTIAREIKTLLSSQSNLF